METSKSDRDAMIDLLYDMYDADLVDVALETLGENELFDGIPAILEDYYYYFDENEGWQIGFVMTEFQNNCEENTLTLCKYDFYKFLSSKGIDYKDYISKRILPSRCVLCGDTAVIYDYKMQSTYGSVDEKLQTCDFKIKQYKKLLEPIGIRQVQYVYYFSDWFKKPEYKDCLDYISSIDGCSYVFV